ncbi:MAG: hypothetical protein OEV76_05810 [Anaerolineae bacterium]|nr:hypothetical protein [Anaerolineae bacterium]
MAARKRSWEQESLSLGDILSFSRRMLSLAKQARDVGESVGLPRGNLRDLASLLLDIEDGVKAQTGVGLSGKIQEYLTTLIPQERGGKPSEEEMSAVDRQIQEVNATLTQLYGAGWLRGSDRVAHVFRVWEKLVAAGYNLPREQFEQGSEYAQLVDDFHVRLKQLQPSKESVESLADMVEPMADRARELVLTKGIEDLPDTGFSSGVRANPDYVRILLEAVANRRPRQYW